VVAEEVAEDLNQILEVQDKMVVQEVEEQTFLQDLEAVVLVDKEVMEEQDLLDLIGMPEVAAEVKALLAQMLEQIAIERAVPVELAQQTILPDLV